MNVDYVSYHGKSGFALLVLESSVGSTRMVVRSDGKQIDLAKLKASDFDRQFCPVIANWNKFRDLPLPPKDCAEKLLRMKLPITKAAIDHIERTLGMDTRGKGSAEIRTEVARLSEELPKGHVLKDVPKAYPDRGTAIAAFTAMRQAIFQLNSKESNMAATKKGVNAEDTKASKATVTKEEAPTKAKGKAAKPEAAPAPEPTTKAKGKVTKVTAEKEAAPVKATKKAAEAAPEKEAVKKVVKAAREAGKERVDLTGPFKLTEVAAKAKTPEALRLHEGSSRHTLMAFVFEKAAKGKKQFTIEELTEAVGDQVRQALSGMVRYGFLIAV